MPVLLRASERENWRSGSGAARVMNGWGVGARGSGCWHDWPGKVARSRVSPDAWLFGFCSARFPNTYLCAWSNHPRRGGARSSCMRLGTS